jgi:chemotaxis protein MotA
MTDFVFDTQPRRLTRLTQQAPRRSTNSLVLGSVAVVCVAACAVVLSGTPLRLLNLEGLVIVVGGTMAATLLQFSLSDVRTALVALRGAVSTMPLEPHECISQLMELSRLVKERGLLVLEEELEAASDDFLRLGLAMVVDGRPEEDIRRILRTEMEASHNRSWRSVQVWETMGNFAPAMGLIGTLLGLIHMMGSLNDATSIGPAMSMALVATLYGSVASNLCFFPIAGRLRLVTQQRDEAKTIIVEGVLSLARLENPMMLEQRLQSFALVAAQGN